MMVSAISLSAFSFNAATPFENGVEGESGKVFLRAQTEKIRLSDILETNTSSNSIKTRAEERVLKNYSGSTLLGFLGYDSTGELAPGWYYFDIKGNFSLIWEYDQNLLNQAFEPRGGWLKDGKLCMIVASSPFGSDQLPAGFGYVEIDAETGNVLKAQDLDPYENAYLNMISMAYVPEEDKVYGIAQDTESNNCFLVSAPASDISRADMIAKLSMPGYRAYSFCYSPEEDCFYGVSYFDKVTKYEKDGSVSEIFNVNIKNLTNLRGGMIYSPLDGTYLYSPQFNTNGFKAPFEIYSINPQNKSKSLCVSQPDEKQIIFMLTPDNISITEDTPKMPEVKNVEFQTGELFADVTFTMPSETHGGSALNSTLQWKALVDNVEIKTGTAEAAQDVTVNYTDLTDGEHALQFIVSSNSMESLPAVVQIFAGTDTPASPTEVFLTATQVTWKEVTQGIHGNAIEAGDLWYKVYINGELYGTTQDTSYQISLDPEKPVMSYIASVVASVGDRDSQPAYSNSIVYGKPMTLPVYFAPEESDMELMTVFNLDGGAEYGVWEYSERWDKPCFASGWSLDSNADDWLILPGISFEDSSIAYSLVFDAACGGTSGKQEFLEVWIGNNPDPFSMTIPIISKTQIRSMDWEKYTNIFSVPEAGTYYIGFHSVSMPFQYSLNICEINVSATDGNSQAPQVVENLEVVSTSDSELKATLKFNLPQRYIDNQDIDSSAIVTAKVICGDNSETATGSPGSLQTVTIGTYQGNNLITIICSVNGIEGQSAEIQTFTGMDYLSFVENFETTVSEDNLQLLMTWEAPVESLNGGYFETSGIQYYVGEIDEEYAFIGEPQLVGTDVYEYNYSVKPGEPMITRYIAIAAANAAGISPARWYVVSTIGTPYTPPMVEEFEDMTLKYEPLTISAPSEIYSNGSWAWGMPELVDPSFDHGYLDYAMVGYSEEGNAKVRLNLPKFSTKTTEELFVGFDIWNGEGRPADISIYMSTYGVAPKKIVSIPEGTGWEVYKLPIPNEFLNREWITVSIDGSIQDIDHYLILSGYSVTDNTGINNITAEYEGEVEFYNLQGIRVENPEKGSILIKRYTLPDGEKRSQKVFINK